MIFAGCNLVEVNPERDKQTVVIKVESNKVTKGDLAEVYTRLVYNYQVTPEQLSDPEIAKLIMDNAIDEIVAQEIIKIKALEYDCYNFSTEDTEKIEADIADTLAYYRTLATTTVNNNDANTDKTQEELDALIEVEFDKFIEAIEYDEEGYRQKSTDQIAAQKLYDLITDIPEPAEGELLNAFNSRVEAQKAGFADGSQSYEMVAASGDPVYYNIAGVRTARHILIAFPEDVKNQIVAHRQNEDDDLADDARKDALLEIEEKATEAYELAAGGSDFDELIVEYGEDPRMRADNYYSMAIDSTTFAPEFVEGLFALESKGDISEPVATDFGYHIILYYDDVVEGPVAFEEVREAIAEDIKTSTKEAMYSTKMTEWKEEMKVKIYRGKIDG